MPLIPFRIITEIEDGIINRSVIWIDPLQIQDIMALEQTNPKRSDGSNTVKSTLVRMKYDHGSGPCVYHLEGDQVHDILEARAKAIVEQETRT